MSTRRAFITLAAGAAAAALAGCAGLHDHLYPRVQVADTAPPQPTAILAPAPPANGAIFQAASYRPLFEDHRARLVGDTLTVQIIEKVSATQKSTSTLNKTGSAQASATLLPGIPSSIVGKLGVGANSNNNFDGKGSTESSNEFSGVITVVVRGVLPNGHLLIAGEKQIGVNDNVDVLRFSGQVDPRHIQPGNSVPSAQIANVRLEQRGRGPQAEAQAMGWLGRVFLSLLPV